MSSTAPEQIVVIGNGMVSHHFIEQLVQQEKNYNIIVISDESYLAYDRVHLSGYFADKDETALALTNESTYDDWQVHYEKNTKVISIDRSVKKVCTDTNKTFFYDKLILATGSYPFVPPIPGNDQPYCLTYRNIDDLKAIEAAVAESKIGVVVGGGLLGLEAANALKIAGLKTHVVEFAPQLMAVQLDQQGGTLLAKKITDLEVSVHTDKATTEIVTGINSRYRMNFADGSFLETDMIVFSAGIRANDALADSAELPRGQRGGFVINDYCQTEDTAIYAIGECAAWQDKLFGLVAPGYQMAKIAVKHLLGELSPFQGADMSTKLKLLGVEVGSIGDAKANLPNAQSFTYQDEVAGIYKKLVIDPDLNKVIGAVLVGDTDSYDTILQYCLNEMALPEQPEALILPSQSGQALLGASALPDSAMICSCHNVAKGDIIAAIDQGCVQLQEIKATTKASTGCGGCAALLKDVAEQELEQRGVAVSKAICEHFDFSRQSLFHVIKVESIKTFDELLKKHGKGLGCDICKPLAGSILASLWNEYILTDQHVSLQDTNDIYLGNMQKDGTYSIVPRVAAGEITPDKLIVLGQVAKKYNLYTKITGGQRIDLFGARVEELPDIWQELVDAGFETGHAYAKAVRTVKSCVGSTWCRYGVQDSVKQAIDIENRYKGLRAPHKLKFAVSGCTRECAEAQSKDIGIIATELGWNLYVCGNGGMKPRHADLFATDLDDETLIQYIDRILMFYIKTADRLQRTSVWLENLEGGLAYLRSVVIDDALGINAELETMMANTIGQYQCEWKTTLESETSKKRFRQFVNSKQQDSNIVFVQERGQIRPARVNEKTSINLIKAQ